MKKKLCILFIICCVLFLAACGRNEENGCSVFKAEILEIYEGGLLVKPVEGSRELRSADQIMVSMEKMDSSSEPQVGDLVEISYRGGILEIYPALLSEECSIKVIKKADTAPSDEKILYNGKEYQKSELSEETLEWLELSEEERMLSSYYPMDLQVLGESQWGITLSVENVTPTGLTLVCTQSGGTPTGELQTGSWYILERLTEEGWTEVEWVPQKYDVAWTAEAWMIPKEDTVEWKVDWEWLYGKLSPGTYRIGKSIDDFRETGDYDTQNFYAEFQIAK